MKRDVKAKDIHSIVDTLRKQSSEAKIDNFRNIVIKVPDNINAEVPEGGNGFLFDSNNGRVYALNTTAAFIFRKIKEELPLYEIVKRITGAFDVDEGIAVTDMQDFLYQLREFSIGSQE